LRSIPPANSRWSKPEYTGGLRNTRRGQSWHRRPVDPEGSVERRRRTWTHSSTGVRSKGAHAVEFSKTVAPLQGVVLLRGAPRTRNRFWGGPVSIAPAVPIVSDFSGDLRRGQPDRRGIVAANRAGRRPLVRWRSRASRYETTWTVTTRWRGRSSKSISTTCCQVPSPRRPSSNGIVSDGPIRAARRCAWAFESWLRMLCW